MCGGGGYYKSGGISVRRVAYDSEDNWLPAVYRAGERILEEEKKRRLKIYITRCLLLSVPHFFRFQFVTISASSL
jgi:hypothetical protein